MKPLHGAFDGFSAMFQNLKIRPAAGGDDQAFFQIGQFFSGVVQVFKSEFSAQDKLLFNRIEAAEAARILFF